MDIYEKGGALTVLNINDFDISETLECGQCFRFDKLGEGEYRITAGDKVFTACVSGSAKPGSAKSCQALTLSPMTEEEFTGYFSHYFDFDRDYAAIKHKLSQGDPVMEKAITHAPGIHILNQDFWEMTISFIISQNNRIPMIKKVIENISQAYGKPIDGGYAFPGADDMAGLTVDELMAHKTGFRAKYILSAVERRLNGQLDEGIKNLPTADARAELTKVYGIGDKVADCVMLFGLGKTDVFPADVWIKRVISQLYFDGEEIPLKSIQSFAGEKWGYLAGFAQQYLFHYARINRIGAK